MGFLRGLGYNMQGLVFLHPPKILYQDETLVKLKNEIDLGRILSPFFTKPISSLRISPIGLVQKSENSWRLISHLSFPSGSSVNDFIREDFRRVKYS